MSDDLPRTADASWRGKGARADQGEDCPLRAAMARYRLASCSEAICDPAHSLKARLRHAAGALGIDPDRICLAWRSVRTKKGVKTPVFNLVFAFNPAFNEVLKRTGEATWSRTEKLWHVPQDGFCEHVQDDMFDVFFAATVDLDGAVAARTEVETASGIERRHYALLPAPVTVHLEDLQAALAESRPDDVFLDGHFRVFDGQSLSVAPSAFSTRHPFLLVRGQVRGAAPRYGAVSVLTGTLEAVGFHKESDILLARFHETVRANAEPVFCPVAQSRASSLTFVKNRIRESLAPAFRSLERLERVIGPCGASLVPLEHVEIMMGPGVKDMILGKVRTQPGGLPRDIADLLDQEGPREIILPLDGLDGREEQDLDLTMLHELAHHLALEEPALRDAPCHGVDFAIILACLSLLYGRISEPHLQSHLEFYNHPEIVQDVIETARRTLEIMEIRNTPRTIESLVEVRRTILERRKSFQADEAMAAARPALQGA